MLSVDWARDGNCTVNWVIFMSANFREIGSVIDICRIMNWQVAVVYAV